MNERLHKIVSANSVRVSNDTNAFIGSGVVVKSLAIDKLYLFTAKHCFVNFNEETSLSFNIEFWNKGTDTFSKHYFKIWWIQVINATLPFVFIFWFKISLGV